MSDRTDDVEHQARYLARRGMTSVEHLEAVTVRARELLGTGVIVPHPDEQNPLLPQPYPWQLRERRDLPKRVWLGTVETFATGEGHTVHFAAGFARDEDEFRRGMAAELGARLAHRAKVGGELADVPFRDMFVPEKLEAMLTGFESGTERPAAMWYFAKYHANYS